jgi:hypothetical protein
MSNLTPIPEPTHLVHADGTIQVCIADICGTVSSWHLVEPKEHQLMAQWLERLAPSALAAEELERLTGGGEALLNGLERHS